MRWYACYDTSCLLFLSLVMSSLFVSFPTTVFSQLSPDQNATMIKLSQLLNGIVSPWNASIESNPCSWKGVNCSSGNSSVIQLSLSGFGISTSDFLPFVCEIKSLQSLDVSSNLLTSIPDKFLSDCGGIDGLKLLNFSKNRLVGSLPTFSGFGGLESLDLSYNSLSGEISLQLDGLVSLKSVNLGFNKFNGSLPMSLGNSTVLEQLALSMNLFGGTIPTEIVNYQNLKVIDLGANQLSGIIPYTIGNLSKLETLILSINKLSGDIPPTIANISTLYRFSANQNQFAGTIPSGLTRFLSYLDLSYNKLGGPIPADLLSQPNLVHVDLSYNLLEGSMPENLSPSLFRLRLGSNYLYGSIPSSFSLLKNLTYLELDNNSLTSGIPGELGSCQSLALLNLAQNELKGSLPTSLGNLTKLEILKLQKNRLHGEIPVEITKLSKLSTLNISWNSLMGVIPPSISNLQNLAHLYLQGNNLSGPLPNSMGRMSSLLELQLGQNQLSGSIRQLPLKLQIALNLSSNLFNGTIPDALSQLTDLEILDLSNNKFSGAIPDSLTRLFALTQLILSNNQLSGVIPDFRSFVTLQLSGNLGLVNKTGNAPQGSLKKKKSVVLPVILALVSAVLATGIVTVFVLSCSRRFLKVDDQQSQLEEDLPVPRVIEGNLLTANVMHRSNIDFDKVLEIVSDPINVELKTRFSTYYKATMPSGVNYFVKKLNWSDKIYQYGNHDKFGQELEILGKLTNSNVMTPLAYVLTVDSAYLFYEYAPKGTLFDVLHGKLGNDLDWASRYSIAVGVAQALTFLHGYASNPILLLDLSSRNIFLKSLKEPVVGDIELCKVIDPTKSTGSLSTVAGSVGYIPPEYAYTMRVTMAGNVYSFGVILLELLTGKPAVSEGTELAKWVLNNTMQQDRLDHILDFNISSSPAVRGQMLAVLKIALNCVSLSPEARPKMKSVLRMVLNAR
ncbi:hypothetical protein Tsubulata_034271 [Turnera subulata]|uniref:Protein kinase domain-containing protein n=1 Tax=Turnera subulata TaxID=218843 RepID=A0A9Q0F8I0_9ROSI|nr:hypothetical protein Tsubulata_034271 [Turnera subulata]